MLKQIEVDNATLNVVDVGQGRPLLLSHAFALDHQMWQHQIDAFSASYRVIAPDMRGFGQSVSRKSDTSMEQMADDMAVMLDTLGVDQPVIFCGLSMGGNVAWQFAKRHPQRLAAVIVCDSNPAADSPEEFEGRYSLADLIFKQGLDIAAMVMVPQLCAKETRQTQRDVMTGLRRVIVNSNPDCVVSTLDALARRPDVSPWLPEVTVPCLIMVGEKDTITPPHIMENSAALVPGAQYVMIEGAGHLPPLEKPVETNAAITRFLSQL